MTQTLRRLFLDPRLPRNAAGFFPDAFSVVELRSNGLSISSSAVTILPNGLLYPSFDQPNIQSIDDLSSLVRHTSEMAGLGNRTHWSVSLPDGASKTLIITLESVPSNQKERDEIISWKIERAVAVPASELRITRQPLSKKKGCMRFLVVVALESVISEYDSFFGKLGWHVGQILPRHLAEAQWLLSDESMSEKLLVSSSDSTLNAVIVDSIGEISQARTFSGSRNSLIDDLFRLVMTYRDKGNEEMPGTRIDQILTIGSIDSETIIQTVASACERTPQKWDPRDFGFDLSSEVNFDHIAAPAGLASSAFN